MADATDTLADGLRRLRELARQLEQRPVTALMAAADEPRFLLVLDHDKPPGSRDARACAMPPVGSPPHGAAIRARRETAQ